MCCLFTPLLDQHGAIICLFLLKLLQIVVLLKKWMNRRTFCHWYLPYVANGRSYIQDMVTPNAPACPLCLFDEVDEHLGCICMIKDTYCSRFGWNQLLNQWDERFWRGFWNNWNHPQQKNSTISCHYLCLHWDNLAIYQIVTPLHNKSEKESFLKNGLKENSSRCESCLISFWQKLTTHNPKQLQRLLHFCTAGFLSSLQHQLRNRQHFVCLHLLSNQLYWTKRRVNKVR